MAAAVHKYQQVKQAKQLHTIQFQSVTEYMFYLKIACECLVRSVALRCVVLRACVCVYMCVRARARGYVCMARVCKAKLLARRVQ